MAQPWRATTVWGGAITHARHLTPGALEANSRGRNVCDKRPHVPTTSKQRRTYVAAATMGCMGLNPIPMSLAGGQMYAPEVTSTQLQRDFVSAASAGA